MRNDVCPPLSAATSCPQKRRRRRRRSARSRRNRCTST
jgi:hypothetical protein